MTIRNEAQKQLLYQPFSQSSLSRETSLLWAFFMHFFEYKALQIKNILSPNVEVVDMFRGLV